MREGVCEGVYTCVSVRGDVSACICTRACTVVWNVLVYLYMYVLHSVAGVHVGVK